MLSEGFLLPSGEIWKIVTQKETDERAEVRTVKVNIFRKSVGFWSEAAQIYLLMLLENACEFWIRNTGAGDSPKRHKKIRKTTERGLHSLYSLGVMYV